jgi:hypothetical protein
MSNENDPWKRLVEASKTAPLEEPVETPPTVSAKTLRQSVQSILLALTWRKWSLLAAILAALIFLVFFFFFRDDPATADPIIPTEIPQTPSAP